MSCDFVSQLSKLRKLSAESVENTNRFEPYKKYLHVEREVETELRGLLRQVNVRQDKCLVLLCGSAGDGKSHLISYLIHSDDEALLAEYVPYNDATESIKPELDCIDTLAIRLKAFNDENYCKDDGKKVIIAINLGTLNNFIESDQGKAFSKLKEYVEANGIFSGYSKNVGYQENSVFQHVSFSDYQVFSLAPDGIETTFLESLIEKVFRKSEENPFYKAYKEGASCSMCKRCPVRHNYEFLAEPIHQKALINRIVEGVIEDKAIVSTREVLNLIYDLIVHPDFDREKIIVHTSDVEYLTNYINWSTPMLFNEFEDISPLLNILHRHDVLKNRNSIMDEDAMRFHALENIESIFTNATENTPYYILSKLTDISKLGGIKPELKKIIYRFIARLKDMKHGLTTNTQQQKLREYIQYLYYQNSGNEKKLAKLYDATKKAVLGWDGQFEEDYICIDDSNEHLWILEQLQLKSAINKSVTPKEGSIQRFSSTLKLYFRKDLSAQNDIIELRVDFSLFELISDMREGYRPTVQDKNRHADFVSFIQQVIEFGNKASRVVLIPKESDKKYKIIFEENDFGFEFKVV